MFINSLFIVSKRHGKWFYFFALKFYSVAGNSHTTDSYVGQQTTKAMREAAEYVKKRMGGGDEDKIILCGAGMTAAVKRIQEVIGITVPSIRREQALKCLPKGERWVVFVGPYEQRSLRLVWMYMAY
jgi:selenocysteine lyase/cysteine desulfurase